MLKLQAGLKAGVLSWILALDLRQQGIQYIEILTVVNGLLNHVNQPVAATELVDRLRLSDAFDNLNPAG